MVESDKEKSRDIRCELLVVRSTLSSPDVSLRALDGDTSAKTILTKAGFQVGDIVELRLLRRYQPGLQIGDDHGWI